MLQNFSLVCSIEFNLSIRRNIQNQEIACWGNVHELGMQETLHYDPWFLFIPGNHQCTYSTCSPSLYSYVHRSISSRATLIFHFPRSLCPIVLLTISHATPRFYHLPLTSSLQSLAALDTSIRRHSAFSLSNFIIPVAARLAILSPY